MNDIEILARTLFGEARGNDVEDAEAIACVVLNRVGYRNWPGTIGEVCLQPKQFSCWNHNDPNRVRIMQADRLQNKWFDRCWQIAERAASGSIKDPTRTSTHYHTRAVQPFWSKGKKPVFETQGHIFFNSIDTPAPVTIKDTLDQERPVGTTRTTVAAVAAGAGVVVAAASETVAEVTQIAAAGGWSASTTELLGQVVTILSIIAVVYARWDDRRRGLR